MAIASVRTTLSSAMAMSTCNLLLLLVPVLSLCGATEYYVRPTEPSSTPCPGYPCRTLSGYYGYIENSDSYFQSDTTFKFLPGTHYMDKPLIIAGQNNISLESYSDEQPQLVAEFPCECGSSNYQNITCGYEPIKVSCAAIQLRDMNLVTLKGINVTVQTPGLSGLLLVNVSNSTVQDVSSHYLRHYPAPVGILINNSQSIVLQSLSAFNYQYGIVFVNTTHINISKIRAIGNKVTGLCLCSSGIITITDTTSSHNGGRGIYLHSLNNAHITGIITITDTTSSHNGGRGIYLHSLNNAHITNTTVSDNGQRGIYLYSLNNAHITNTTVSDNGGSGIYLYSLNNTYITKSTSLHNGGGGIYLYSLNNTYITNTTSSHNEGGGIDIYRSNNVHITNTIASENGISGIFLYYSDHAQLTIITASHNGRGRTYLYDYNWYRLFTTYNSHEIVPSITEFDRPYGLLQYYWYHSYGYYKGSGITLHYSDNAHITDTTTAHNGIHGLFLYYSNNSTIISNMAKKNRKNGIIIYQSERNIVANTTTKHNAGIGLFLYRSYQNNVSNTTAWQNRGDGLHLDSSDQNNVINTTASQNMRGLSLLGAHSNTFTNTNTIKNRREGLFLSDAQGNNFNNIISMCNKYGQISSYFRSNNTFTNTIVIRNGGIGIFEGSQIININSRYKGCFYN